MLSGTDDLPVELVEVERVVGVVRVWVVVVMVGMVMVVSVVVVVERAPEVARLGFVLLRVTQNKRRRCFHFQSGK